MATNINRDSETFTFTIASGASLSGAIDLVGINAGMLPIRAIIMSTSWTAANLTFQAGSHSDDTFLNVYDGAGNELTVSAGSGRMIVDIPELAAPPALKIRSGTSGTPVNQAAARTIYLIGEG